MILEIWGIQAPFTLCNRKEGDNRIFERFNRFLANSKSYTMFLECVVTHGSIASYDHISIWLNTEEGKPMRCGSIPFRFESMWVGENGCTKIIKEI